MIDTNQLEALDKLFVMYERARRVSCLQQRGPVIDAAQFAEQHINKLIEQEHAELFEQEQVATGEPLGERGIQG